MKKQCLVLSALTIFVMMLLVSSSCSYAQEVPSVAQVESQFQSQLSVRDEPYGQPKATSYYDDLVDHYEQDQLMRDVIAQCV